MSAIPEDVKVYFKQRPVGTLAVDGHQKMMFQYDEDWLKTGFRISWSLPLRTEPFYDEGHRFFANLLPEADFRRDIEKIFKVSENNDYSLLLAIGGDCAGAFTIGSPFLSEEAYYEEIDKKSLVKLVKSEGRSGMSAGGDLRLSLAGAQGKIPLYHQDGIFSLPLKGATSSHIIKFNRISGEIPKLIENEFFMNRCASHAGLQVIDCWLESVNNSRFMVCVRYDRSRQGDQEVHRIHQEDFCQVLSHPSSAKYQKEGGPGLANCGAVLRTISLQDFNRMLDWFLFNYLMSNSDAHGKNLSLLYSDPHAPRLAPFYDLVCTRAYPRVDRNLAMAIGSQYDPDKVSSQNFKDLARDLGITFPFLRDRFHLMAERLTAAIPLAKQDLRNQGVALNQMQHVFLALEKHFYKHTKVL